MPIPSCFFCTSAGSEYLEAVIQSIISINLAQRIQIPLQACEGGAVFFDCKKWKAFVAPFADQASLKNVKALENRIINQIPESFSLPRMAMASIRADNTSVIDLFNIAQEIAEKENYHVGITHSASTLDITPLTRAGERITKWEGIKFVCEEFGYRIGKDIDPDGVGYIGDANGDIPVLEKVNHPFCPANATQEVKAFVNQKGGRVSPYHDIEAVLEMFSLRDEFENIKKSFLARI